MRDHANSSSTIDYSMVRSSLKFNITFNRSGIGWGLDLSGFGFLSQVTSKSGTYGLIYKKSFKLFISIIIGSIDGIYITGVRSRRAISESGSV